MAADHWLRAWDQPWFMAPLIWRDQHIGAIILGRARVTRELASEDYDLLEILALQIASYVAEERATRTLMETQRFERLSKQFTFVAHDLKNLVSQLSLIVQNAKEHGANPDFQRDAMATIGHCADKMRSMLLRVRETAETENAGQSVDIGEIVAEIADKTRRIYPALQVLGIERSLMVNVDRLGFMSVMQNLLQNAMDAAGPTGQVAVRCISDNRGSVEVEVSDSGPGMSLDFIRDELFRPFASTKQDGFGIGMYQVRDLIGRWQGTMTVESEPGAGTRIRIALPLGEHAGIRDRSGIGGKTWPNAVC